MNGSFAARSRFLVIVLASLTLVAGIALSQIWAQSVDSQPLVGKWEGTWVNMSHPHARGDYNITITKVEGNIVHGRIEKQGFPSGSATYDIVGTLEGDKLMYGTASTSTELMVNGKQLRGTSVDGFRLAIEMTKIK